jgi:hypothetical protein
VEERSAAVVGVIGDRGVLCGGVWDSVLAA